MLKHRKGKKKKKPNKGILFLQKQEIQINETENIFKTY